MKEMAVEYFCCYHSYARKLAKLSDQEVGRLFRALLQYSETGEAQELAGRESVAFDFIADDIDRAKEKYGEKCRQNSENAKLGRKRTLADASERIRSHTNGSETSQYKDKDEDENEDPPPSPPRGQNRASAPKYHPDWFERFWALYPRKTNREASVRAWDRLKPDLELCRVMDRAIRVQIGSVQWQDKQHIPHPSTWLNGKRWLDELGEEGAPAPPLKGPRPYHIESMDGRPVVIYDD